MGCSSHTPHQLMTTSHHLSMPPTPPNPGGHFLPSIPAVGLPPAPMVVGTGTLAFKSQCVWRTTTEQLSPRNRNQIAQKHKTEPRTRRSGGGGDRVKGMGGGKNNDFSPQNETKRNKRPS